MRWKMRPEEEAIMMKKNTIEQIYEKFITNIDSFDLFHYFESDSHKTFSIRLSFHLTVKISEEYTRTAAI